VTDLAPFFSNDKRGKTRRNENMISRRRYSQEFKEKIGRELSLGQISISEVCKREQISIPTLTKWRNQFGFGMEISQNESFELKELRKKVGIYESALGEMAMEIHLLKKINIYAGEQKRKKDSLEIISMNSIALKKVVERSK
jgi:transposase-like protein